QWSRVADDLHSLFHLPDDVDSRGIAVLDDAQQNRTPAVRPHHILLHQRTVADIAEILDINRGAIGVFDWNVVQVIDRRRYGIGAHGVLGVADFRRAGGQGQVLGV